MKNAIAILLSGMLFFTSLNAQKADLQIDHSDGPAPWSNLDVNANKDQFQFAIVTDRTGGARPGVFLDGIRKLNLLQPEFVMSVGDLIEGYTEDVDELNRQWTEFNGFIDELQMPFFYLPGNHDITNQVMEDLYIQKFGKTYYHFVYKDVLFLCLNSEDQRLGAGNGTISDKQFEYVKKALQDNPDVKWTLLFMHQPIWNQKQLSRWPDVEKLLASRKHTVFTGHVHHYVKYERNNGKYFTLGTTGGGSALRGPNMGEFDHVSWVTMTERGPIMANLMLNGIWDEDVSTEQTQAYAKALLQSQCIQIDPLFVDLKKFQEETVKIKLTNNKDLPMTVRLKDAFSWDLKGELDNNEIVVPPNSVAFANLTLQSKKRKKSVGPSHYMRLKANVSYKGEGVPEMAVPMTFNIGPENKYQLENSKSPIQIDGNLDEWTDLPYQVEGQAGDVSAQFGLCYDEKYLYVAARVKDDDIQIDTSAAVWNQDFVGFLMNADPMQKSAMDNGEHWYFHSMMAMQAPAHAALPSTNNLSEFGLADIKGRCLSVKDGYNMELAIPLSYVEERQGKNWKSMRINFVVQDQDKGELEKPRYTFKPDWRGPTNRVGSGMFFR